MNAHSRDGNELQQAILFQRQGRTSEAEALCHRILLEQPAHAGALYLLGLAALQAGQLASAANWLRRSLDTHELQPYAHANLGAALLGLKRPAEALACFDNSLALAPGSAQTLYNRGTALLELKRPHEALASFEGALHLKPDYVEALANRGSVLNALQRFDAALESYDCALRLSPEAAEILNNRGNVLVALGRPVEALASFESALRLRPQFAAALKGRGRVLQSLQRPREALADFERVLQLEPDFAEGLYRRGSLLRELGQLEDALASFGQALNIAPEFAVALNARGNTLLALKQSAAALADYDAALRLRPEFAQAWNNRGNALRTLRRFDEALASFERSIELGEQRPEALGNHAWALLEAHRYEAAARAFSSLLAIAPDYDYALGAMLFARLICCEWSQYGDTVAKVLAAVRAGKRVIAPFPILAISDNPEINLQCARSCASHRYPTLAAAGRNVRSREDERIRVAYVSPDLRDHVVSYLLAPLVERHDRRRFETTAISLRPAERTAAGERVQAAFDQFHDVSSMSDAQVAGLMRDLRIDIAVDLAGFTGDMRPNLFAHRSAPVQVSYLGYPGSMGVPYMDYLVADRNLIPGEQRSAYAEKVVYLPDCYQVNHAERPQPPAGQTREEHGLPAEGLVFCCFNNSFKINPEVFSIWMRTLANVRGSTLWLAGHRPSVMANLRAAAAERGIEPERLVFAEHKERLEEHLVRYALADLFLDTFPFNAHATASDALWYGVPVVTCQGNTFAGRVAASLLHAVGLPELITGDLREYESKIVELARTPALLADLRAKLARNRRTQALFDLERFRGHLESAYIGMWERQQRGEAPESFSVPA